MTDAAEQQLRASAWRIVTAMGDGEVVRPLTVPEAQALRAESWDTRGELARVKDKLKLTEKRNAALTGEIDSVVGQCVSEELRANATQRRLDAALVILKGFLDVDHATHWRARARDFLNKPKEP